MASTIITAPSTINPKSIAPKLIKLALTPNKFIKPNANNKDSGMADATIKPALKFPRNSINTKITMSAPSIKFFSTVPIALFTRSVLSKNGSIITSSGSDACTVFIRSFTLATTAELLAPFTINTIPPTTSFSPLYVIAPYRGGLPNCTLATSLINIGVPLVWLFTTMFSISSNVFTIPIPLIK